MVANVIQAQLIELIIPEHDPQAGKIHAQTLRQAGTIGSCVEIHALFEVGLVIPGHVPGNCSISAREIVAKSMLKLFQALHVSVPQQALPTSRTRCSSSSSSAKGGILSSSRSW